ncbi:MAG: superoxide dismutase [Candidatus Anstonellaceae archaeon]
MEIKKFELPKLDYEYNALEPVISERIMKLHHQKHHAAYVNNANAAAEKLALHAQGKIEIDVAAVSRAFSFNLNGHILHTIFWKNMRPPKENNLPEGKIATLIEKNFFSFESFKKQFAAVSNSVEGSGWGALYFDGKESLFIQQIEKHNLMHLAGLKPILVLDVWEHSYYLDYENRRADFVENFFKIINWDDVEKRLV